MLSLKRLLLFIAVIQSWCASTVSQASNQPFESDTIKARSIKMDFRALSREIPQDVTFEGLSELEEWGRWSDAKEVKMTFPNCLPKSFTLTLGAHAYGPNEQQDFEVTVGQEKKTFQINNADQTPISLEFDNNIHEEKTLVITVPQPISPLEFTRSFSPEHQRCDDRILGIAIIQLLIQERNRLVA